MLFNNITSHKVTLPAQNESATASTIGDLISWLCKHLMTDSRQELFILDENMYVCDEDGHA